MRSAFTLIEVLVVVLVVAVLAGLMLPTFAGRRERQELRSAADRLLLTARFAHERAVRRRADHRLVLLPPGVEGGPGFRVEAVVADAGNEQGYGVVRTGNLRPATLPEGVFFDPVNIANEIVQPDGRRTVRFNAEGHADAAAVVLTNGVEAFTLLVWPNAGRVRLVPGTQALLPNGREDLDA